MKGKVATTVLILSFVGLLLLVNCDAKKERERPSPNQKPARDHHQTHHQQIEHHQNKQKHQKQTKVDREHGLEWERGLDGVCWKKSAVRSTNGIPNVCPSGQVLQAGLCYTPCQSGYNLVAGVCWQTCPSGWTDGGVYCYINAQTVTAHNNCPWYDACGLTLAKGCSWCNSGYTWYGCTCTSAYQSFTKSTYTVGAGSVPPGCPSGYVNQAGICYSPCSSGYTGQGIVCWENCSQVSGYSTECGAMCADNASDCATATTQISEDGIMTLLDTIESIEDPAEVVSLISDAISLADDLDLPMCS